MLICTGESKRDTSCVSSCAGVADGDYQSCTGCHVYSSCSNGGIYDERSCPVGLVWDDNKKRCEYKSDTCNSGGLCVSSCTGVLNGDYQSCQGCHVYVTCSNGIAYDGRNCPAGLLWDDNIRRCEYTTDTCTPVALRLKP